MKHKMSTKKGEVVVALNGNKERKNIWGRILRQQTKPRISRKSKDNPVFYYTRIDTSGRRIH